MKTHTTDMLTLDGSGYLYFIPKGPQATRMTREDLREFSPSGKVKMDAWFGKSFTFPFIGAVIVAGLAFTWVIDWAVMSV